MADESLRLTWYKGVDSAYRAYSGGRLLQAWEEDIVAPSTEAALEMMFSEHNQDDRASGSTVPSMSVGDVVRVSPGGEQYAEFWAVDSVGWLRIEAPSSVNFVEATWREFVDKREAKELE